MIIFSSSEEIEEQVAVFVSKVLKGKPEHSEGIVGEWLLNKLTLIIVKGK